MRSTLGTQAISVLMFSTFGAIVKAETVTLFPSPFDPANNLHGETGGVGSVGTTYILEGETAGIPFTATLVEGASLIAETVNIPTLSIELAIGCIVEPSGGDAICQSVIGSGTAKVTDFQTVEFQPFPVAIGTDQPITSTASATITSFNSLPFSTQPLISGSGRSSRSGSGISSGPSSQSFSATASESVSLSLSFSTIVSGSSTTPSGSVATSAASSGSNISTLGPTVTTPASGSGSAASTATVVVPSNTVGGVGSSGAIRSVGGGYGVVCGLVAGVVLPLFFGIAIV